MKNFSPANATLWCAIGAGISNTVIALSRQHWALAGVQITLLAFILVCRHIFDRVNQLLDAQIDEARAKRDIAEYALKQIKNAEEIQVTGEWTGKVQ